MNQNIIAELSKQVKLYASQRQLNKAFETLKDLSSRLPSRVMINDFIEQLEGTYRMMLHYAINNISDPERESVYNSIIKGIFEIVDRISRESQQQSSTKLYFSTMRYEDLQPDSNLPHLLNLYAKLCDEASLYNLITADNTNDNTTKRQLSEKDELQRRIFKKLWITHPLSKADATAIEESISSDVIPEYFKTMMLSSLLLGMIEYFDEQKLNILLNTYQSSTSETLAMRALTASLLSMHVNRDRLNTPSIEKRIIMLRDTTNWSDDVRMSFMQFIRTRDTERINRKVQDELLPQVMKLRPDIARRIDSDINITEIPSIEENPEWAEMLDKSGITEKIRELSEMQQEGGDVFMSTFSHLKSYPFFSDVPGWFEPFHLDNPTVARILGSETSIVGNMLLSSPFLCNSDKFSFVLALESVPEAQRKMMTEQIDAHNINAAELQSLSLPDAKKQRENIVNKYVQDLYRFFNLYRRKNEFDNPFNGEINLFHINLLNEDINDKATATLAAEFYFSRKFYDEAICIYETLINRGESDCQLLQKYGYSLQQCRKIDDALNAYRQAELIDSDNIWTLRRMAICYRQQGKYNQALETFKRIETLKPDDLNIAYSLANCLLELDQPEEALKYYYKVDFLDNNSTRALRPLAWCLFVTGDYNKSKIYYDKILSDNPRPVDYINMGHLALAIGDTNEAVQYYVKSINANPKGLNDFLDTINEDMIYLNKVLPDPTIAPLVIDAALYQYAQS